MNNKELIIRLSDIHTLEKSEYKQLIESYSPEDAAFAAEKAVAVRKKIYGNKVYVRGLIEFSNHCKNDCLYCGIRRSNKNCERYRLSEDEILSCCSQGYELGFRTFVLQSGEDPYYTEDRMCSVISKIRTLYKDCAITLSVGEKSLDEYKKYIEAGADRFLLRHETADKTHYGKLHPSEMSFDNRMKCLEGLRKVGFTVGCGFMVGSPFQTSDTLAEDLKFIESFRPEMCGIGPFISHKQTPFADKENGSAELTCFLLSLIRLIKPDILLPATTALGTVSSDGREKGILSGANVIMPNLSPVGVRKKYELYENKICTGEEAAECRRCLERRIESIGYEIVTDRGDPIKT